LAQIEKPTSHENHISEFKSEVLYLVYDT
jgi:hypothetical protein